MIYRPYKVYRMGRDKKFHLIAETLYIEDAQLVFKNWHAGYIERDGIRVEEKNLG